MGTTSPLRGLLQVDEHDVVAAGLELQGLAGLHLEARQGAHLHHVVVHDHLVQFDHVGGRAGHADEVTPALLLSCMKAPVAFWAGTVPRTQGSLISRSAAGHRRTAGWSAPGRRFCRQCSRQTPCVERAAA
jgi:hypothetical protein